LYVQDEKAIALSEMHLRKVICNGEVTGVKCKNYWSFAAKTDALNAEMLKYGEKFRNCTVCPGYLVEFDGWESMPHHCDRYVPDSSLIKRMFSFIKKIFFGKRFFDPTFEDYNPITKEELTQLNKRAHAGEDEKTRASSGMNHEQDLSVGIPGLTSPASREQMVQQVGNLAVVKSGKKTIDDVMKELEESNFHDNKSPMNSGMIAVVVEPGKKKDKD